MYLISHLPMFNTKGRSKLAGLDRLVGKDGKDGLVGIHLPSGSILLFKIDEQQYRCAAV